MFLVFAVILLSCASAEEPCIVELQDSNKGIHLVVESCGNIGTFSIGGLYGEGRWEKLTFLYPQPWKGSFISVKVDDAVYTNYADAKEMTFMDPYLESGPEVVGDSIVTRWMLPRDALVEQRFTLIEDGVLLNVTIINGGRFRFSSGVRFHIDTMLGENDGAAIYIPGDGLKSTEAEYSGEKLNFRYWKAYNEVDDPWVISTGMLAEQTYPTKVSVSNWKKSIYSSWDYSVDPQTPIIGDSAVIIYYELGTVKPGELRSATTSYLNGDPILPVSKGYFGVAEIVTDRVDAVYCPDSKATIKADVISRRPSQEGKLVLEIRDEKNQRVYRREELTGVMDEDAIKNIPFSWQTPGNISPTYFDVTAVLYDLDGKELDRKEAELLVDYAVCRKPAGAEMTLLIILIPVALIMLAAVIFLAVRIYSQMGEVEVVKEKIGENVKVSVWNKKKKSISECFIIDRLPEGAEVDVTTSGVLRRGTEIVWNLGRLESGGKAVLEYRIKDVEFLPPAIVRWDSGENVSR